MRRWLRLFMLRCTEVIRARSVKGKIVFVDSRGTIPSRSYRVEE